MILYLIVVVAIIAVLHVILRKVPYVKSHIGDDLYIFLSSSIFILSVVLPALFYNYGTWASLAASALLAAILTYCSEKLESIVKERGGLKNVLKNAGIIRDDNSKKVKKKQKPESIAEEDMGEENNGQIVSDNIEANNAEIDNVEVNTTIEPEAAKVEETAVEAEVEASEPEATNAEAAVVEAEASEPEADSVEAASVEAEASEPEAGNVEAADVEETVEEAVVEAEASEQEAGNVEEAAIEAEVNEPEAANEVVEDQQEISAETLSSHQVLRSQSEWDVEDYNDSVETPSEESNLDVLVEKAASLRQSKNYDEAIHICEKIIEKETTIDITFKTIIESCLIYKDIGRTDLAIHILRSYINEYADIMGEDIIEEIKRNFGAEVFQ